MRRLLEHAGGASGRSSLVFDDIHWAEPTFLDLIEYLAGCSDGRADPAPRASARPELLDARPAWARAGETDVVSSSRSTDGRERAT